MFRIRRPALEQAHRGRTGISRRFDAIWRNRSATSRPVTETSRVRLAFLVIATVIMLVAVAWCMSSCTSAQIAEYQSHVDSRSIEGYTKGTGVGAKYTVHYR